MISSDFLEPITYENLSELKEGDWIWDDKVEVRKAHGRILNPLDILEPYGFRQIHILDPSIRPWRPFMLSDRDNGYYVWTDFELGRFYKFKSKGEKEHET